ncbi:HD domain-containing protein (plasmid) [Nocardia sp. CA-084685]|uniref:HD domain-containing protein n=1 Tax=Nocardia sp. CA-084685 TaxID=3239970 RepID=UPI003D982596
MVGPADCDWEWADKTGGKLSAEQQRQWRRLYVKEIPAGMADQILDKLGFHGDGHLDFDALTLPRTQLTRAAEDAAVKNLSDSVLAHSYRCYYFALVLAGQAGVEFDNELAYAACLLHDLNLESPRAGTCFAVGGARRARQIALDAGESLERAEQLAAGIAGHMNLGVAHDLADAGGFIAAGAMVDVFGVGLRRFNRAWVQELMQRHPRLRFTELAVAAMLAESAVNPDGRVAFIVHRGATDVVRSARFQE